jgi:hypothetical protein
MRDVGHVEHAEGDRQADAHGGVEAADHRAQHDGVEQEFPGEHRPVRANAA